MMENEASCGPGILHGYEAIYAARHHRNNDAVKHADGKHKEYSVNLNQVSIAN